MSSGSEIRRASPSGLRDDVGLRGDRVGHPMAAIGLRVEFVAEEIQLLASAIECCEYVVNRDRAS